MHGILDSLRYWDVLTDTDTHTHMHAVSEKAIWLGSFCLGCMIRYRSINGDTTQIDVVKILINTYCVDEINLSVHQLWHGGRRHSATNDILMLYISIFDVLLTFCINMFDGQHILDKCFYAMDDFVQHLFGWTHFIHQPKIIQGIWISCYGKKTNHIIATKQKQTFDSPKKWMCTTTQQFQSWIYCLAFPFNYRVGSILIF